MTVGARGFTLVEMLVAMLAFSLLATAAVAILNGTLRNTETLGRAGESVKQIQITRAMMRTDLGQVATRATRDAHGGVGRVGLVGEKVSGGKPFLSFVRRGWDNHDGQEARSSLQHVEYLWEGETLLRRTRPYLDPTPQTPQASVAVLTNVRSLDVGFLVNGQRLDRWIVAGEPPPLPEAIEVTINIAGIGELRQLCLVGEPRRGP